MMANRSEHLLADLGAVHAGAVPLTVYATFSSEQIAYIAADCSARVAVLEGAEQVGRWLPVLERLPELHTVVVLDASAIPESTGRPGPEFISWAEFTAIGRRRQAGSPELVEARTAAIVPGDNATLLYTSGTTGDPKGVFETHHQVLYQVTVTRRAMKPPERGVTLSYLPWRTSRSASSACTCRSGLPDTSISAPSPPSSPRTWPRCVRTASSASLGYGRRSRPG